MTRRAIAPTLLGLAAVVVAILLLGGGGGDRYEAKLVMDNANGLRPGSPVNIGGVPVGDVDLTLDKKLNKVVATLRIKKKYAPLGRDASAAIVAQNILGQKQVALVPGDKAAPAPSGFVIPASRVSKTTDLDQVLSVLDAGTRARLAVLVNEAGQAFTGRKMDFNKLIGDAPRSLADATLLLEQLDHDNAALDHLLATSDRYVAETTRQRSGLVRLVDRVGQTAETVATKRAQLRATLARAPGFLVATRRLLASLRTTAQPLGQAARNLTASTPSLRTTLDEIEPFRQAAAPALAEATAVAPTLSRLGTRATPVLRRTRPVLTRLNGYAATTLPPVTKALDGSIDNTLSVVENWARAIQFRDGVSHIFRGEASFAPDELDSALARLMPKQARGRHGRTRPAVRLPAVTTPRLPKAGRIGKAVAPVTKAVEKVVGTVLGTVDKTLGGAAGNVLGGGRDTGSGTDAAALLDYLLGK